MERIDYSDTDFETLVEKMEELTKRVETDEYWIKYGGNLPHYGDGKEIIDAYLEKTDTFKIERQYTLIVHLNEARNHNLMKKGIQNRTSNHEVQILKMNGETIYISLSGVEFINDLIEAVYWELDNPRIKRRLMKLIDGERVLRPGMFGMGGSRLIITDETVLTLVISEIDI